MLTFTIQYIMGMILTFCAIYYFEDKNLNWKKDFVDLTMAVLFFPITLGIGLGILLRVNYKRDNQC